MGNTKDDKHLRDVHIMAERLAILYYRMVKNIIAEVGEERAEELVKKIIWEYGTDCGLNARKHVESLGEEAKLENFHLGNDLPSVGWTLEDDRILYCPFADTWKKLDFEKWGRLYCFVDQAKYEGYNPDLRCFHDKNVLDGDDYCIIRVEEPNENES
ncbi:MAG TPA: L-2-amino-thiazoline-4-carboxylic acid hydrolase [Clostridiaceae bacterium]|nr:L-2-amino-thiazoline-4-carboxylic acid hydrolase [Clostridiaceae bacterium]